MLEKTIDMLSGTVVLDALPLAEEAAAPAADSPFTLRGDVLLRWYDRTATVAVVPEGVREIGRWAFRDCVGLTEIMLPEGVTAIGFEAFRGCAALTKINIPAGVRAMGARAFLGCSKLDGLRLPQGVAMGAAQSRRSLETFVSDTAAGAEGTALAQSGDFLVHKGALVQYLGHAARVSVPAGLTAIKDQAFRGCDTMRSVDIPASVQYIHDRAFSDCRGLAEVRLPPSPISFGQAVFSGCTALERINFSGGQSPDLFQGCTALKYLDLPEAVAEVSSNTFQGCTGLTRLTALGAAAVVRSWGFWASAADEVVGGFQTALIAPKLEPERVAGPAIRANCALGYLACPHLYDDVQSTRYEAFLESHRAALLEHACRHGLLPLLSQYIGQGALPEADIPALVAIAQKHGQTESAALLLALGAEGGSADALAQKAERDIAELLGF